MATLEELRAKRQQTQIQGPKLNALESIRAKYKEPTELTPVQRAVEETYPTAEPEPIESTGMGELAFKTAVSGLGTGGTRIVTTTAATGVQAGYNAINYVAAGLGKLFFKGLGLVTKPLPGTKTSETFSELGDEFYDMMRSNYKDVKKANLQINSFVNARAEKGSEAMFKNVKVLGTTKEGWQNKEYAHVQDEYKPRMLAFEKEAGQLNRLDEEIKRAAPTTQEEADKLNEKIDSFNTSLDTYNSGLVELEEEYKTSISKVKPDALSFAELKDPRFLAYDAIPMILENGPLMLAQIYSGKAILKGANTLTKYKYLAHALGITGATSFGVATNAHLEAQISYDEAIKAKHSIGEAQKRYQNTLFRNTKFNSAWEGIQMLALLVPENMLKIKSTPLKVLVNVARASISGSMELMQERGEDAIQAQAAMENFDKDAFYAKLQDPTLSKTDFLSFGMGFGVGGGSVVLNERMEAQSKKEFEYQAEETLKKLNKWEGETKQKAVDKLTTLLQDEIQRKDIADTYKEVVDEQIGAIKETKQNAIESATQNEVIAETEQTQVQVQKDTQEIAQRVKMQHEDTPTLISRTEELITKAEKITKKDVPSFKTEATTLSDALAQKTEPEAKKASEQLKELPAIKEKPQDIQSGDTIKIKGRESDIVRTAKILTVRENGVVAEVKADKGIPGTIMFYPSRSFVFTPQKPPKTKKALAEYKARRVVTKKKLVKPTPAKKVEEPQKPTKRATIIDPDLYKKEFDDYRDITHPKYSAMAKEAYTKALKENPNPLVKFSAGGSGSGKSELVINRISTDFDGIIYDGTFANYDSAVEKINEATRAGKKVEIFAILPNIYWSWKFVQKRAIRTGRDVPLNKFIEKHVGFIETLKKLAKEGNYKIKLLDTREIYKKSEAQIAPFITENNQIVDILDEVGYTKENLTYLKDVKLTPKQKRKAITSRAVEERRVGEISGKRPEVSSRPPRDIDKSLARRGTDTGVKQIASIEDVNKEFAKEAHQNMSHFPEKAAERSRQEYADTVNEVYEDLKEKATTPEQLAIVEEEMLKFKERYLKAYNTFLSAKSRTASSMIVGPARFPVAKNRERMEMEMKRYDELVDLEKKARASIEKKLKAQSIEERGGEKVVADEELTQMQEQLDSMKEANKIMRSKQLTFDEKMDEIAKLPSLGDSVEYYTQRNEKFKGFPSFSTTNLRNKIKSRELKKTKTEKREAKALIEPISDFEGGKVVRNNELDRIQILFDEKPDVDMIQDLKKSGWRWSPKNNAWQRQATQNAIRSAGQILKDKRKAPETPKFKLDETFKGFEDISTVILEKLTGKTTVSSQFISDLTKTGDLKQAERDLIRETLEEMKVTASPLHQEARKYTNEEKFVHSETGINFIREKAQKLNEKIDELVTQRENLSELGAIEGTEKALKETGRVIKKTEIVQKQIDKLSKEKLNIDKQLTDTWEEAQKGDKINVQEFADKVKTKLLPLETIQPAPRHESFTLLPHLRGDVAEYTERIYESPIKTSAGDIHYEGETKNYFAHTRVEDMADGITRRIDEVQGDLMQKGRLELERTVELASGESLTREEMRRRGFPEATIKKEFTPREKELSQLQPYRNTWYERIIREEIKRAAQDGKTKLLFPTGETSAKIEKLGASEGSQWRIDAEPDAQTSMRDLEISDITFAKEITDGNFTRWIITEVLEAGKFRATQEANLVSIRKYNISREAFNKMTNEEKIKNLAFDESEQFDISGKIDPTDPIYRFYEKDIQKYLKRIHPEMKRITDPQGVEWFEIAPKPEEGKKPVLAFKKDGEVAKYGQKEALEYLEDFKKRLKIDFPVYFVDTIFAGKSVDFYKKEKILTAYGVTTDNSIALARKLADYTAEHETVHLTLTNLHKIQAFHGMTREQILTAQSEKMRNEVTKLREEAKVTTNKEEALELEERAEKLDLEYNTKNAGKIEEQLAIDFEAYMKEKHAPKGIIRRFFVILKKQLLDTAKLITRTKGNIIRNYYDILAEGESIGTEMVRLKDQGIMESFLKEGVLDFGLDPEASFKFEDARVSALKTELKDLQQTLHLINTGQRKASVAAKKQLVKKQAILIGKIKKLGFAKFKLKKEDIIQGKITDKQIREIYSKNSRKIEQTTGKYQFETVEEARNFIEAEIGKKRYSVVLNAEFEINNITSEHLFGENRSEKDQKRRAKLLGPAIEIIEDTGLLVAIDKKTDQKKGITYYDIIGKAPDGERVIIRAKLSEQNKNGKLLFTVSDVSGGTPTSATPSSDRSLGGLTTSDTLTKTLSEQKEFVKDIKFKLSEESDVNIKKLKKEYNELETTQSKLEDNIQKHKKAMDSRLSEYIPTPEEFEAMSEKEQDFELKRIQDEATEYEQLNQAQQMARDIATGKRKIRTGMDIKTELQEGMGKSLYMRTMRKDKTLPTFDEITEEVRETMPDITTSELLENINEEVEKYLERKTVIVETRNQLRKLRRKIAQSKTETKENKDALRDVKRKLELQKKFLERRDVYVARVYKLGEKAAIQKVSRRRKVVSDIQDAFAISDKKKKEIIGARYIHLMSEEEFNNFLVEFTNRAQEESGRVSAIATVKAVLAEKQYQKADNLRKALGLPTAERMSEKQANRFIDMLVQYEYRDTFLTKRQLETVHRSEWGEIKTIRELGNKIHEVTGVSPQKMSAVMGSDYDIMKNDTLLANKDDFHKWLVDVKHRAIITAQQEMNIIRDKINPLAKKARASRRTGKGLLGRVVDKAIPTDEVVFGYIESENKEDYVKDNVMTEEEITFADTTINLFETARDYMADEYDMNTRQNYVTHIRRGFLEAIKAEKSVWSVVKEIFTQYKVDEQQFTILDSETGKILAMEKFFKFAMMRSGELKPTQNVAQAVEGYFSAFTKKRALDSLIPEIMVMVDYIQSGKGETKTGLSKDPRVEKFVKQYLNNVKGRKFNLGGIFPQGGGLDVAVRGSTRVFSMMVLGANIATQVASYVGEAMANSITMNYKQQARMITRTLKFEENKRMKDNITAISGRNPFTEITDANMTLVERIGMAIFIGFSHSNYKSTQNFFRGTLTSEEFNTGKITLERLSELEQIMNRTRLSANYGKSVVGATSASSALLQFRTWAIPVIGTLAMDTQTVINDVMAKKGKQAFTTREAFELRRAIINITLISAFLMALGDADDKDRTMTGTIRKKILRELSTIQQALKLTMDWEGLVPAAGYWSDVSDGLFELLRGDKYSTSGRWHKKGEYKGVKHLKRLLTPYAIKQF